MSDTATYGVKVDTGDSAAKTAEAAQELEKLSSIIKGAKANIAQMTDSFRNLRGVSDEVKAAKEKLKASIEAERNAISSNSLALIRAGTSYAALADGEKKAAAAAKAAAAEQEKLREKMKVDQAKAMKEQLDRLEKSLSAAGGPVSEIGGKFTALKTALSTGAGAAALAASAIVAVVVVLVGAAVAVGHLTAKLLEWIYVSGLANRQLALQREAWTGSATNALHLGHQLDALSGKVATPRAELEKLAGTTVKALNNSRVSGQGIVDTFNLIAQASAAMGDEVGAKLGDIITRAKNTGRVQINPFELQGTGIKVQDIAGQLAKSMHVSVGAALQALAEGRVKVDDAAAAIRAAVEARFGEINAKMRLGQPLENFVKRLQALTRDVNLEPILKGIEEISLLFDQSTVSGQAAKGILEDIATAMGEAFTKAVPILKVAFKEVVIGALRIEIAILKARNAIRDAFKGHEDIFTMADALAVVKGYVDGLAAAVVNLVEFFTKGFLIMSDVVFRVKDTLDSVRTAMSNGWENVGTAIVDGLTGGLVSKLGGLKAVVGGMANSIKEVFSGPQGIDAHSPSKVFEQYGKDTAEGYQQGVRGSAGGVQNPVDKMAPGAPTSVAVAKPRSAAGGAKVEVNVNLHNATKEAVEHASQPGFLQGITKAVEDALVNAGMAVQTEPAT